MSVQSVLFVHLAFLYGPSPHDPGSLCGAGSPSTHHAGAPPRAPGDDLCGTVVPAPTCRRSALHQGDFPVAGKVTKGAPRAAPFGIPPGSSKTLGT